MTMTGLNPHKVNHMLQSKTLLGKTLAQEGTLKSFNTGNKMQLVENKLLKFEY